MAESLQCVWLALPVHFLSPQQKLSMVDLYQQYPDWDAWYTEKAVRDPLSRLGVVSRADGEILAFVITSERDKGRYLKLDTFYVLPGRRQQHISAVLWRMLYSEHGSLPLEVTLHNEAITAWRSTLNARGFSERSAKVDLLAGKRRFFSYRWYESEVG